MKSNDTEKDDAAALEITAADPYICAKNSWPFTRRTRLSTGETLKILPPNWRKKPGRGRLKENWTKSIVTPAAFPNRVAPRRILQVKRHLKNNQPAGEAGVIMRAKPLKGPAPLAS
jgi:hypothetical protein